MEAFRRQASKLREQVAKQQQAVLKQLGRFNNDTVIADEAELQCHEQLQKLYTSTREAKHFQRDIVRGVEGFVTTSSKQMEIVRKLAEDCCKYGNKNQNSDFALANASLHFGTSHNSIEKESEILLNIMGAQVCEPLRVSIAGAPLEDARHLTQRYDRIRQEVEAQATEVLKRQVKSKEDGTPESSVKLQHAEAKLSELKSIMMALGREAMAAMSSVEAKQQQLTFQLLLTMVDAEKSYHRSAATILENLYSKIMILEKQQCGMASQSVKDVYVQTAHANAESNGLGDRESSTEDSHFIAQVIHPFDAQADGELSLCVGDYVVVRQVSLNGWSEGEFKSKAGWFPSAYIERRDIVPASEVMEVSSLP